MEGCSYVKLTELLRPSNASNKAQSINDHRSKRPAVINGLWNSSERVLMGIKNCNNDRCYVDVYYRLYFQQIVRWLAVLSVRPG